MPDLPTYHVLALSGGGYRGLYTATVLAELEAALKRPIASHFDLICGTSVGGMLALGLAAEIPAHALKALFEQEGPRIFDSRSLWRRLSGWLMLRAKHDAAGLRDVLNERFGEMTLGDLKQTPHLTYIAAATSLSRYPHPTWSQVRRCCGPIYVEAISKSF